MKLLKSLIFALLLLPIISFGDVNLQNGNFYITYTDIIANGKEYPLEVTRTYNSKSSIKGWFGLGWGSNFETSLSVQKDGSILIKENGSGRDNHFSVSDSKKKIYASYQYGKQIITKTNQGYKRESSNKNDYFDLKGNLVKSEFSSGYNIDLIYKKNKLLLIKDSESKVLNFEWFPNGQVKSISNNKNMAQYEYNSNKSIVRSKDVEGNIYLYSYDKKHILTQITYSDKKSTLIEYDENFMVSSVTKKDGTKTFYTYASNPKNADLNYWTIITDSSKNKQIVEYEYKITSNGEKYLYRYVENNNGHQKETVYSESQLPLSIKKNSVVTTFEYNSNRRLTRIKNNNIVTDFKYDEDGLLIKANTNYGKSVSLGYNQLGLLDTILYKDNDSTNVFTMKYNSNHEPIELTQTNVGTITIEYFSGGNTKMKTKQSLDVAMKIKNDLASAALVFSPVKNFMNL